MPEVQFNDSKSFDENVEAFLQSMESSDAEFGKILRDNIDCLKGAFDDSTRRAARNRFNTNIVAALDEIFADDDEEVPNE